ncbi:ATP-binding cassette domain-containing protein [Vibrio sp. JC009]|uniref:ATP-binding cassette domain-containing protein n=1 Tax=Vibrio sp. JC009 TaxID=2912314 RepID=UPI0023AECEDF|nr:ATP-binding cassette domain-containing protein [Vibrio sp. JC009]WED23849.1 ATP-binding cassette domain-containing protein [Vibrio sp. JC009]
MNIEEIKIISGHDKSGNREAVDELVIRRGDVIILAGPTGSGKSLLLSDLEQLANGDSPSGRQVLVNGEQIDPLDVQITASLSQNMHFMMDLDVGSFIRLHAKSRNIKDEAITEKILDLANSLAGEPLSARSNLTSLSGGQSRALMIADTALISNAPIVLVDEIENAGINKTKGIEILASEGKMVLIASHDPNLIITAQKRVIMKNGSMSKLIISDDTEREHLKYFLKMDGIIEEFRENLRHGNKLDKNTLKFLQENIGA